jgi:hypothetical protein
MILLADRKKSLPFVFIIGFNKTGTTALHEFFDKNGWPSIHWDKGALACRMVTNCLENRPILEGYDSRFRVFSDMAVQTDRIRIEANKLFPVLDRDYPGAYFIYNTRKIDDWIASRSANFVTRHKATNLELEMRRLNTDDRDTVVLHWRTQWQQFDAEVSQYFKTHPRFLKVNIDDQDLPEQVAALLDHPMDPVHWRRVRTNGPS